MHTLSNYAVTEVLSLVTVVIIASSAITAVLLWAIPELDAKKQSVRIDSALTQFKTIRDVIEDVTSGGAGASNFVDFVTDAGDVSLDSKGDRFIFYYSLVEGFDFNVSNLGDSYDRKFGFKIESAAGPGSAVDSFLTIYYLYSGESETVPITNQVEISKNLADAVKIDVTYSGKISGRIWLFDSGYLSYEVASSSGVFRLFAENGATISVYPSGYLYHKPGFYNKDNSVVMKMIQIKPGDIRGGSGKGVYKFLIRSNASYVREVKADIHGCFKMQIYGGNSEAWVRFYTMEHGFKKFGSTQGGSLSQDTLYLEAGKTFSLVQSVCDARLVEIK
ncbi:MAG: hypothetical protein QHH19_00080 [Candidatus Thermoplasmatota archaeon]|nr:hypothetical protein [Candidatus Thermoplasmatota archaeon]